jgi:hypothetical protein
VNVPLDGVGNNMLTKQILFMYAPCHKSYPLFVFELVEKIKTLFMAGSQEAYVSYKCKFRKRINKKSQLYGFKTSNKILGIFNNIFIISR